MKLLSLPKVSPGEFEGRTFDEALRLARQQLGEQVLIRCWRVRRGGVFGFFAKESFIAGLTTPTGAELSRLRGEGKERLAREAPPHLYGLVEATTDELCLESDLALDRDFSKVLAEAEAALMDAATTDQTVSVPVDQPIDGTAEKIEGLSASLAQLGVPSEYLPDGQTLDYLVRSLSALPTVAPKTKADGSLLIVVGPRRDALATAHHLVTHLGLDDADLIVGERNSSVRQRVARRRSAKKMTVLVVEASLKSHELDQVATWIEKLKPEYVLAAVPSTVTRTDFDRWHDHIGWIEALALTRLSDRNALYELMGALPVAFLDGAPATTLRWVSVLINAMLAGEN